VPERIEPWTAQEIADLPSRSLAEIGARVLRPYVEGDVQGSALLPIVSEALNFAMPIVPVEPDIYALELFHGPTQAFKDVGARVMARLMAELHEGGAPLTVLVATSGDTGGAVASAFHAVPQTRVVILYPQGRVSPTQEAQLTMFNGEAETNVCAYAVAGSFDECQRLTKEAFADAELGHRVRLTSANSINIGRLLPQMIYYVHAVAQLAASGAAQDLRLRDLPADRGIRAEDGAAVISTPSGNFGNLTAGLMQKRAGLPIARFVAATNVNDIVPTYLLTGRFEPRPSLRTIANAMDVGNPSNFERMMWLYGGNLADIRADIVGSRHTDDQVRSTIRRVYDEAGYVLDPHSAIAYLGLKEYVVRERQERRDEHQRHGAIFLATAHPAKFGEIVEPILGCSVPKPAPLVEAIARGRHIMHLDASLEAVREILQ
jgi:threonine synthase